eukprot:TRINITY_DN4830_c0_g1_i2.p2 TRINITY_DN4830_c0_g1~~TRINITY_DN4830_c0_g1_i2.p2  ORF type:complete len:187 (-),score=63.16 TRINITY_DN4830_c0_g1_i2:673-1233(-)
MRLPPRAPSPRAIRAASRAPGQYSHHVHCTRSRIKVHIPLFVSYAQQEFWAGLEEAAGVRGDVRARAVELRRARLLRRADLAEDDVEDAVKAHGVMRRDYLEGALLLLAWSGVVVAMILFSGYHDHMYMLLRPLMAVLTLPLMLAVTLFWLESGKRGAAARDALRARAQALRRRAARALAAATATA